MAVVLDHPARLATALQLESGGLQPRVRNDLMTVSSPLSRDEGRSASLPSLKGWMVSSLVHEPVSLLCAFAAHHLDQGAGKVLLFFDCPNPDAAAVLTSVPNVQVIQCDAAFWRNSPFDIRPHSSVVRQRYCAQLAYDRCRYQWSLFCDADEFVHTSQPLAETLTRQGIQIDFLRLPVAERIFHAGIRSTSIFDGSFRKRVENFQTRGTALYGDKARYMGAGLLGHSLGKAIVRTNRPFRIGVHFPRPRGKAFRREVLLARPAYKRFVPGATLLHFDGLTPLHWAAKLLDKIRALRDVGGPAARAGPRRQAGSSVQDLLNALNATGLKRSRKALVSALVSARHDPARIGSLLALPVLSPEILCRLRAEGLLVDAQIAPDLLARQTYKELNLDYSVTDYDRQVRELYSDVLSAGLDGTGLAL